jgi:hypothetical protein
MTTIRARCPHCGEVDMSPEAIELAVRGDTGTGSYRFVCPACMTLVQKRADRKIVDLLSSVGVSVAQSGTPSLLDGFEELERPRESTLMEVPVEHLRQGAADSPAFTYDDLLSFHFLLEDDAWLAEMVRSAMPEQTRRRRPKRA